MEVVNQQDKEYYDGNYFNIYFGSYGEHQFKVYCNNDLQAALEILGKYCKDKGYSILIDERPYDEILADCNNDENIFNEQYFPINGGEYYLGMVLLYAEYKNNRGE